MSGELHRDLLQKLNEEFCIDDSAITDETDVREMELEQHELLTAAFRIHQETGITTDRLVRLMTKGMPTAQLQTMLQNGELSPAHFPRTIFSSIMEDSPRHSYLAIAADHGIDIDDEAAVTEFFRNGLPAMGEEIASQAFDTIAQETSGLPPENERSKPMTIGRLREILREAEAKKD